METEKTARLEKEIIRLNSIIDALLTENRLLKQYLAVRENTNAPPTVGFAVPENMNASPNSGFAVPENVNASPNSSFAVPENMNASPNCGFAVPENMNVSPNSSFAVPEKGNGKTQQAGAPAGKVMPGMQHVSRVADKLFNRPGYRIKKGGRLNATKLLIHFYHGNSGDYPTLMRLTGLSYFGLGKTITSLKSRGWIVRSGWQQFSLTDAARSMVEQACNQT